MPRLSLSLPESITAHKHKIAVTAASCAAVTGAIVGAVATGASSANAAIAPVAHVTHSAVHAAAPAAASPIATSTTPAAAPTSAKPSPPATTKAAAPAPAPATTKPAAAPAVTPVDPYAGLSPYQVAERIVPSGEFGCFDWIVTHESGWDVHATNPSSGAYGLGQALPGDKMASAGSDWRDNPVTQIKWTLGYMDERYGSPCSAQSFWEAHNWY